MVCIGVDIRQRFSYPVAMFDLNNELHALKKAGLLRRLPVVEARSATHSRYEGHKLLLMASIILPGRAMKIQEQVPPYYYEGYFKILLFPLYPC